MKNKLILMGLLSLMAASAFGAQKHSKQAEAIAEQKFIEAQLKGIATIRRAGEKNGPLYFSPRIKGTVICAREREDRLIWCTIAMKKVRELKKVQEREKKRKEVEQYLEKQLRIDPELINGEATDPDYLKRGDSIGQPTLLMDAAYFGETYWVEFFIKRGANVSYKAKNGLNARSVAGGEAASYAAELMKCHKQLQTAVREKGLSEAKRILLEGEMQKNKHDIQEYLNVSVKIRKILDGAIKVEKGAAEDINDDQEDGSEQKFSAQTDGGTQDIRPAPQEDVEEQDPYIQQQLLVAAQADDAQARSRVVSESSSSQAAKLTNPVVKPATQASDVTDIDADQNKLTKQKDLAELRKQAKEKQEQADDVQVKMPANAVKQAGPAIAKQAADEEKARATAAREEIEQAYYDLAVLMFKDPNRRNELSKPEYKRHLEILKKRYHGNKEEDAAIKKLAGIEPDRVVRIKPTRQPVSQNQSVVAQQQPKKSGKQANTRGSSHATTQKNAQEVSSKKAVQTPAKPKPLNPPGSRMAATEEELEAARTMQERQEQRAASSALREAAGPLDACYDEDAVLTHSAKLLGLDDNTPTLGHSKMKLIPHVQDPVLRAHIHTAIVKATLAGAEEKKKERSGKAQARPDIRVLTARDEQTDDGGMQWQSQELKEVFEEAQKCLSHVAGDDDDRDWTDWYE